MDSNEAIFIWPISFKSRRMFEISWKRGECFGSQYFASNDNTWWNLCLYPLGDAPFKRDVTLRLCRQSSGTKVFIEGEIHLYSPFSKKEFKFPIRQSLSKNDTYVRVPLYRSLKEMYRSFPSNKELHVECKMNVCHIFNEKSGTATESSDGTSVTSESSLADARTVNADQGLEKLSGDLQVMLKKESFSDVTLRCGNLNLRAHKNVLSARSNILATMFDPSSPKTTNSVITVKNMDGRVLEEMVSYIYTGKTSGLCSDMAKKLFIASKDYGLETLQSICYDLIISKMTRHTVVDILLFAEKRKSEELKKPSVKFLLEHFSEIKHTDSWKKFIIEEPELGVEILSSIVETSNLKTL